LSVVVLMFVDAVVVQTAGVTSDARTAVELRDVALLELPLVASDASECRLAVAFKLVQANLKQSTQTILLADGRLGTIQLG